MEPLEFTVENVMEAFGVPRQEAEFMVAIDRGEFEGDVIAVDETATGETAAG